MPGPSSACHPFQGMRRLPEWFGICASAQQGMELEVVGNVNLNQKAVTSSCLQRGYHGDGAIHAVAWL